jgi:bifunctional UDP-N-acetylglucosamine pyrophosphorylase / glucosamine-1-phosphate N-acetyltransferase
MATKRKATKRKATPRTLTAVILAAGAGKRLKSATPKVLHPICGKPALWYVLQSAAAARPVKIVVVVGHGEDAVRAAVSSWGIKPTPIFVEQTQQLGTGHAVLVAEKAVGASDDVLVLGGDYDPVGLEDVRKLIATHRRSRSAATIASTVLDDPGGYGRVVRDGSRLVEIIEQADASREVRAIREVSIVLMAFRRDLLFASLPLLDRENRQREYYLNRVIPILLEKGEKVTVVPCDTGGAMGLNSRRGLAAVTRVVRDRINAGHMGAGVTLVDPNTTYIDVGVRIGRDTVVHPNTFVEGASSIGNGCVIGPSARLVDTTVSDGSEVAFSVSDGAKIGRRVTVGPFARLRPGTVLDEGSAVGNFVEVKASRIGRGSKAKHLSYVGDAQIGRDVNVGAATVFVNYDGFDKHTTVIEDEASIGSDTMLVAPVRVGKGASTGAGSVITKDVPAGSLAIERSEQRIVRGYRRRKQAERSERDRGKGA